MKTIFYSLLATLLVSSTAAWATPAQVLIIRHAEKGASGKDLSSAGDARAQALVGFFENNPEVTQYGTPAAIYAMSNEALAPIARSRRSNLSRKRSGSQFRKSPRTIRVQ
jgi:hypothetical protein